MEREGFRYVHILNEDEIASDQVEIRRVPLWNNKSDQLGPFDIFGDAHGCADELESLLTQLGWERSAVEEPDSFWGGESWRHPDGRLRSSWETWSIAVPACWTPFASRGTWSKAGTALLHCGEPRRKARSAGC